MKYFSLFLLLSQSAIALESNLCIIKDLNKNKIFVQDKSSPFIKGELTLDINGKINIKPSVVTQSKGGGHGGGTSGGNIIISDRLPNDAVRNFRASFDQYLKDSGAITNQNSDLFNVISQIEECQDF